MRSARSVAARAALGVLAASAIARGDTSDPSHGRIEGDVELVAGAGATIAPRGPRAALDLRVRYLESAGVFATYEDAPLVGSSSEPQRLLAAGLELRPLFLFRWLRGHETTDAFFDLALDSLGLDLGAVFAANAGLQVGLGLEIPLLARVAGPWIGLHGGLRWSDDALQTGVVRDAGDRSAYLAITLAWHQTFAARLVAAR